MAESMTFYADPNRANYDLWLYNFNNKLASGQPVDNYENTVDWAVSNFGSLVSPQEIGSTLYGTYAKYGPAPAQPYYGGYVQPVAEGTGVDTGSTYGTGTGTGLTAQQIEAARASHEANLRELERQRQEGLFDFNQKYFDLGNSQNVLGKSKDEGYQANSAYFGNVSPDAYQSQIQNYNQKVLDAYNEGMNTVTNNKAAIDFAKTNWENRYAEKLAGENSFDFGTGQYTQPYTYQGMGTPIAPTLASVNANPYGMAAKLPGVAQWSPNQVGQVEDPYKFLK